MGLTTPIVSLFGEEWERFKQGLEELDPASAAAYEKEYKRRRRNPDGTIAINIPGWSDVWHGAARVAPLPENVREYWAAKKEKRAPNINAYDLREIQRRETQKDRMAQSAQPAYAQAMGSILTAVDNVQDFLSTTATFARFGLWGLSKTMQAVVPGASEGTARAIAQVAARRAEAAAAAAFAQTVAQRAAAGELVAKLALNNPALFAAARRTAIEAAGKFAFDAALTRALLWGGARLIGRFIPVVGWVLLASDLLNLISLLGMMATPAYALACSGPQEALAAGIPAALFKRVLKSETWAMHNVNPFSRKARATRAIRAGGRLPSVSNLVEVVQTTDSLFGVGASFGGLVGVLNEATFGLSAYADGKSVAINYPGQAVPVTAEARKKFRSLPPRDQRIVLEAGQIATSANAVWRVQDVFDEDDHLHTALATMEATAILYWFWHDLDFQDSVAELLERPIPAPLNVSLDTRLWAEHHGYDLEEYRRWWFDGAPKVATGEQYIRAHKDTIPAAIADFLRPRRNAATGALFGALVNQTNDYLWMLLENDPDFFKWELTTDARLISGFIESGWMLPTTADQGPVWAMWQAARAELDASGKTSLPSERWAALARQSGVSLLRMLPPESPVPAGWAPDVDQSLL